MLHLLEVRLSPSNWQFQRRHRLNDESRYKKSRRSLIPYNFAVVFNLLIVILLMVGCTKEMASQDKPGVMKLDRSARDLRSDLPAPAHSQPAEIQSESVRPASAKSPIALRLSSGQRNYEIYCSLCHDRAGSGLGMITLRGFPRSNSLSEPAPSENVEPTSKAKPLSQLEIESIILEGRGAMPAFSGRLTKSEREDISLFVRTLYFSHHVPRAWLKPNDLNALGAATKPQEAP